MQTPTPDQLRDFFKSDIFQIENILPENYDLAVAEFYRRFASEQDVSEAKERAEYESLKQVNEVAVKATKKGKKK